MTGHEAGNIVQIDLHEHPAFRAWRELQPATDAPSSIDMLKGKPPREGKELKRAVFRLAGVGPAGSAVIAKHCQPTKAIVEDAIYQNILPNLPFPLLDYYGMVKEANGEYRWIFLQDAGEESYSKRLKEHRLLGARWLALMHTSSTDIATSNGLPDKGSKHCLQRLQTSRDAIQNYLADHHELQAGYLVALQSIITQCDLLESRWDHVEALCKGLPWTLVHGDFVDRNLCVRQDNGRLALLPFDWGEAGWGTPATDIMQVDVEAYWLTARDHWPWLNSRAIERSARAGKFFRYLDAIYWELDGLKYEGSRSLSCLKIYESWLAEALQAAAFEY